MNRFFRHLLDAGRGWNMTAVAAGLALSAALTGAPAHGQAVDCGQILGQINALDRANQQTNPYADAISRQRAELAQQQGYSHSIGCDNKQFLFFGSPPPAQCPGLETQIQRGRANLSQLEANAAANNNTPERQGLVARYNASCRQQQQQQRQKGFFDSFFGGSGNSNPNMPGPGDTLQGGQPLDQPMTPTGGAEALCVRTCDGGFFPLVYSSRRVSPDTLTDFCKASCPNVDVRVYTRVPGQEVKTAVGLDGTPYLSLPNALKFEKTYDPACTCKPAGQNWAEALTNAERILGHEGRGDIIVTPEKSAEMARPKTDTPGKRGKNDKNAKAGKSTDDAEAHDAASAAQVPTASNDSAGIATGDLKPATSYAQGQGKTVDVTGPDGVRRQVRIVGPQP